MSTPSPQPTTTTDVPPSTLVTAWLSELTTVCVTESDHLLLRSAEANFEDVASRLTESGEREAWPAWFMLGRTMANGDVSLRLACEAPNKLGRVIDRTFNAQIALASLLEGYVRAQEDVHERKRAMNDDTSPYVCVYEGAAVVLAQIAIADDELRSEWADRLASHVAKRGIRKVVLSRQGNAAARVAEALATFDIDVVWS